MEFLIKMFIFKFLDLTSINIPTRQIKHIIHKIDLRNRNIGQVHILRIFNNFDYSCKYVTSMYKFLIHLHLCFNYYENN